MKLAAACRASFHFHFKVSGKFFLKMQNDEEINLQKSSYHNYFKTCSGAKLLLQRFKKRDPLPSFLPTSRLQEIQKEEHKCEQSQDDCKSVLVMRLYQKSVSVIDNASLTSHYLHTVHPGGWRQQYSRQLNINSLKY